MPPLARHSLCDIVDAHICMYMHLYIPCPSQCMHMHVYDVYACILQVWARLSSYYPIDATSPNHSPSGRHQEGPTQGTPGHIANRFVLHRQHFCRYDFGHHPAQHASWASAATARISREAPLAISKLVDPVPWIITGDLKD